MFAHLFFNTNKDDLCFKPKTLMASGYFFQNIVDDQTLMQNINRNFEIIQNWVGEHVAKTPELR